jgi:hypothetical protein
MVGIAFGLIGLFTDGKGAFAFYSVVLLFIGRILQESEKW